MYHIIRDIELCKITGDHLNEESIKVLDYFENLIDSSIKKETKDVHWEINGKIKFSYSRDSTLYFSEDIISDLKKIGIHFEKNEQSDENENDNSDDDIIFAVAHNLDLSLIEYMFKKLLTDIDFKKIKSTVWINFNKEMWIGQGDDLPDIESIN